MIYHYHSTIKRIFIEWGWGVFLIKGANLAHSLTWVLQIHLWRKKMENKEKDELLVNFFFTFYECFAFINVLIMFKIYEVKEWI